MLERRRHHSRLALMNSPEQRATEIDHTAYSRAFTQRKRPPMKAIAACLCRYLPEELRSGCDWRTLRRARPRHGAPTGSAHRAFTVRYLGQRILISVSLGSSGPRADWMRKYLGRPEAPTHQGTLERRGALPCYPLLID